MSVTEDFGLVPSMDGRLAIAISSELSITCQDESLCYYDVNECLNISSIQILQCQTEGARQACTNTPKFEPVMLPNAQPLKPHRIHGRTAYFRLTMSSMNNLIATVYYSTRTTNTPQFGYVLWSLQVVRFGVSRRVFLKSLLCMRRIKASANNRSSGGDSQLA